VAGRVEGKVAFITGAARSQGRSHALRLAQEGADVIAVDICAPVESISMYPPATEEDLAETVRQVEALDRRIVATKADVRDPAALRAAVDDGVAQLGRLDIVLANAGVFEIQPSLELTDDAWQEMIDINLTGVWNTCRVALPHLIAGGRGGSIVLTSSTAGLKGIGGDSAGGEGYTAAKHGVVGLMRTFANTLAQHRIRVNTVHPTGVNTPMVVNPVMEKFLAEDPSIAGAITNLLPVDMIEAVDISNAILFLVSDDGRYVTGVTLPVDAGILAK
jgi:(+)-trans-carveol dehydrogenase